MGREFDKTLVVVPARGGSKRIPKKKFKNYKWSTNDVLAIDGTK